MVVPALLTDKRQDLIKMIDSCSAFADYLQIDIMDGRFVPSKSVGLKDLEGISVPIKSEAHLMVNRPLDWLDVFKKLGSFRIVFHYESTDSHRKVIETIRKEGFSAGLAVNPETQTESFRHLIDKVDTLLFLSVNPGYYGAPFIPEVLEKIKLFRKAYPVKNIGIDGGIKLENLKQVLRSGVDYVCVGSAILKDKDPEKAYMRFKGSFHE